MTSNYDINKRRPDLATNAKPKYVDTSSHQDKGRGHTHFSGDDCDKNKGREVGAFRVTNNPPYTVKDTQPSSPSKKQEVDYRIYTTHRIEKIKFRHGKFVGKKKALDLAKKYLHQTYGSDGKEFERWINDVNSEPETIKFKGESDG